MPSIGTKQNNRLIRPARPSPLPCARGSGSSRLGLRRPRQTGGEGVGAGRGIGTSKEHVPLCLVVRKGHCLRFQRLKRREEHPQNVQAKMFGLL